VLNPGRAAMSTKAHTKAIAMLYRGVEYSVVQGIERHLWQWAATVSGTKISGARQRAGRGHRKCEKSYCARYREAALQAGYRWKKIAMTFGRTTAATAALVFALISVTGCALAQGAPPEKKPMVRGKPIVQAKPSTPMGCKLVGTVKGTKIWAGNCVDASELRGTTPAEEVPSPPPPVAAPPEKE